MLVLHRAPLRASVQTGRAHVRSREKGLSMCGVVTALQGHLLEVATPVAGPGGVRQFDQDGLAAGLGYICDAPASALPERESHDEGQSYQQSQHARPDPYSSSSRRHGQMPRRCRTGPMNLVVASRFVLIDTCQALLGTAPIPTGRNRSVAAGRRSGSRVVEKPCQSPSGSGATSAPGVGSYV